MGDGLVKNLNNLHRKMFQTVIALFMLTLVQNAFAWQSKNSEFVWDFSIWYFGFSNCGPQYIEANGLSYMKLSAQTLVMGGADGIQPMVRGSMYRIPYPGADWQNINEFYVSTANGSFGAVGDFPVYTGQGNQQGRFDAYAYLIFGHHGSIDTATGISNHIGNTYLWCSRDNTNPANY